MRIENSRRDKRKKGGKKKKMLKVGLELLNDIEKRKKEMQKKVYFSGIEPQLCGMYILKRI